MLYHLDPPGRHRGQGHFVLKILVKVLYLLNILMDQVDTLQVGSNGLKFHAVPS